MPGEVGAEGAALCIDDGVTDATKLQQSQLNSQEQCQEPAGVTEPELHKGQEQTTDNMNSTLCLTVASGQESHS